MFVKSIVGTVSKMSEDYMPLIQLQAVLHSVSYSVMVSILYMCYQLPRDLSKSNLKQCISGVLFEAMVDCDENKDLIAIIKNIVQTL